jgi:hypothetical protein
MDGAVQSGERVANEVLYSLFAGDKSVYVEYEKTFYHHRDLIRKIEEKQEKQLRRNENLRFYSKSLLKFSTVIGVGYIIMKKFNCSINLLKRA